MLSKAGICRVPGGSGGTAREVHKEILSCSVLLSELGSACLMPESAQTSDDVKAEEVAKVTRRLKLWAKRQDNANAKILNAFLELEKAGASHITEDDLKNALPNKLSFESNFYQMKIIAEKTHGKTFELYGTKITLWEPVVKAIREYEKIVFSDK